MISAGFANDMINLSKSNRDALKIASFYKHFDRFYITSSIISREAPSFKKGSAEYLLEIKRTLQKENQLARRLRVQVLIVAAVLITSLFSALLMI